MSTRSDLAPSFRTNIGSADAAHYCSDGASDRRARDCAAHGTRRCSGRTIRLVPSRTTAEHRDDRDHCRCLRWVSRIHALLHRLSNDRVVARNDRAVESGGNYIRTHRPDGSRARPRNGV